MKKIIKQLWSEIPESIKCCIRKTGIITSIKGKQRNKMKEALLHECKQSMDPEIQSIGDWIGKFGLYTYPYSYREEYKPALIEVLRDEDGYPYVMNNGKRLYGRKSSTDEQFAKECSARLSEQDYRSPHCYVNSRVREPDDDCIIAELGAAEAAFSLEYVDRAKKIYLFECLDEWMIPLKKTFDPWKEKVEIIPKYVGKETCGDFICLDDFFSDKDVTVVKADIEGYEIDMLDGAKNIFTNKVKQAFVCVYHHWNHEEIITKKLIDFGFETDVNPHYMVLTSDPSDFYKRKLRHGVVYGQK